jgi:hypothetical protein
LSLLKQQAPFSAADVVGGGQGPCRGGNEGEPTGASSDEIVRGGLFFRICRLWGNCGRRGRQLTPPSAEAHVVLEKFANASKRVSK